jgi:hypothetical protein
MGVFAFNHRQGTTLSRAFENFKQREVLSILVSTI